MTDQASAHWHIKVTTYSRPWRNWFRKTYTVRCWTCEETWEES